MAIIKLSFLFLVLLLTNNSEEIFKVETIAFGAGCFWGMEYEFQQIDGVVSTDCIYTNIGTESVLVKFEKNKVSLESLLQTFIKVYKPDVTYRLPYRATIQFHNEGLRPEIDDLLTKYGLDKVIVGNLRGYELAEGFHQNRFLLKNRQTCQ